MSNLRKERDTQLKFVFRVHRGFIFDENVEIPEFFWNYSRNVNILPYFDPKISIYIAFGKLPSYLHFLGEAEFEFFLN